jgi:hypothetical protein
VRGRSEFQANSFVLHIADFWAVTKVAAKFARMAFDFGGKPARTRWPRERVPAGVSTGAHREIFLRVPR